MKQVYNGNIINGKIVLKDYVKKAMQADFKTVNDMPITLTIERAKKKRSNDQNAYYFGVVVQMIKQGFNDTCGYNANLESTHEFIKSEFNFKEIVNEKTGEIAKIPNSTTELSTFEFMQMLEKIQIWAIEFLGINIPDPNEQLSVFAQD